MYGMSASTDSDILDRVATERRHIVTADTDFATLTATTSRNYPSILLLRVQPSTVVEDCNFLERALQAFSEQIMERLHCFNPARRYEGARPSDHRSPLAHRITR